MIESTRGLVGVKASECLGDPPALVREADGAIRKTRSCTECTPAGVRLTRVSIALARAEVNDVRAAANDAAWSESRA